jgi:hypothetical protein
MWGRATPMIDVSMMTMNWAVAMTARAAPFDAADEDGMSPPS